jgi:signal transduction histidine kinase
MNTRKPRSKAAPARTSRAAPGKGEGPALRAEIAALRAEIDALTRDRAELCSALSHDLRNPLTVVVWSAQLLARRVPEGDPARRHLDGVTRAAEELNQMLSELSDAARIPDGRLARVIEPTEDALAPLLEQAAAASRPQIEAKGLALTLDLPPDLGAIACDRERITRLVASLVAGAVRRSPKGGAVRVSAGRRGAGAREEVRISVEDRGPVIEPVDREVIFTLPAATPPGETRRPRPAGSAIALFVARGVAEAHGGRIWVDPAADQGARFVLSLPVSPSSGPER